MCACCMQRQRQLMSAGVCESATVSSALQKCAHRTNGALQEVDALCRGGLRGVHAGLGPQQGRLVVSPARPSVNDASMHDGSDR